MAWTTPKTWNVGEVLTASNMNVQVRDNLNYLYSKTPSYYNAKPSNPSSTSSATGVMAGLAGSITPSNSGRVVFMAYGYSAASGGGSKTYLDIRYGTGSAPSNGAAPTGTSATQGWTYAANFASFNVLGYATSLSVGTTYWWDISFANDNGAGTSTLQQIVLVANES